MIRHKLRCALVVATLLDSCLVHAIDCPALPEQSRKDWDIEVKSAVGRIGPVKAAELEAVARSTTRDLMGRLPKADKVYLEQMMYATYCSALRDDPSLSEAQKTARIRTYNLEVGKTLAEHERTPAPTLPRDLARAELARIPVPYTAEAFIDSAENGRLAVVKLFLAAGMDPNSADSQGSTALMYAAKAGHADIVSVLLQYKADVNRENVGGGTALGWAANDNRVVDLLLKHHPSQDSVKHAFLTAAKNGETEMLKRLWQSGLEKEVVDAALLYASGPAVMNKSAAEPALKECVQFLLAHGANVDARDSSGWTPLMHAVDEEYALIVQTLLDAGANVNAQCSNPSESGYGDWTALMLAVAKTGRHELAQRLLDRGASTKLANLEGKTALSLAADNSDAETVRTLLSRGADANARDRKGVSVLMRSVHYPDTLRVLLAGHADPDARDEDGWTALMWAASDDDQASIGLLLDAGADLHARDKKGRTALMHAVRRGNADTVRLLLARGARATDEDADGKTVLNYAEEDLEKNASAKAVMARILRKAGAK